MLFIFRFGISTPKTQNLVNSPGIVNDCKTLWTSDKIGKSPEISKSSDEIEKSSEISNSSKQNSLQDQVDITPLTPIPKTQNFEAIQAPNFDENKNLDSGFMTSTQISSESSFSKPEFKSPIAEFKTPSFEIKSPDWEFKSPSTEIKSPAKETKSPITEFKIPNAEFNRPSTEFISPYSKFNKADSGFKSPSTEFNSPSVGIKSPCIEFNSPKVGFKSPTTKVKSPISEFKSPVTEFRNPVTEFRSPTTEFVSPVIEFENQNCEKDEIDNELTSELNLSKQTPDEFNSPDLFGTKKLSKLSLRRKSTGTKRKFGNYLLSDFLPLYKSSTSASLF